MFFSDPLVMWFKHGRHDGVGDTARDVCATNPFFKRNSCDGKVETVPNRKSPEIEDVEEEERGKTYSRVFM